MDKLCFKRLHPDAVLPKRAHADDGGLDLVSVESVTLRPGQRATLSTGLAVSIPSAYAGFVVPRSGLAAREGLTVVNAPGLVDAGYRGELKVILLNTDRSATIEISPGDRIAQLVIVSVALPLAVFSDGLEAAADGRGGGGFGSTGKA